MLVNTKEDRHPSCIHLLNIVMGGQLILSTLPKFINSFNLLGYLLQPRSIRSTRHLRSRDSLPQWCCRESVTDSHSRREGEKRTERRRLPTPKSSLRESRSRKSENWREDDHQDLLACLSPAHKLHLLKSSTSFIVIIGSIYLMIIK